MTPTVRAAGLLATIGLAALLLPTWLVVASALLLLAVTAADGWSVREAPTVQRTVRAILSRGLGTPLNISALAHDGRKVLLRQPATPSLSIEVSAGDRELSGELIASRRGRHTLPGVASASVGPLGLARWHHRSTDSIELLVYPDLHGARRLVSSMTQGRGTDGRQRGALGLGTDFESIREYSPGDDIRRLNWRSSARLGRPMSNQYRVEQERTVHCLVDAGRLMAAPIGDEDRILLDVALDALSAVAFAADELGDRCGAIAFDSTIRCALEPRRLGGRRVVQALFDMQPSSLDSDFEQAFLQVRDSRRALVLVLTDLVDQAAARSLVRASAMLSARHVLVVASANDSGLGPPPSADGRQDEVYELLALQEASLARTQAAAGIRSTGAEVIEAPAKALAERCLTAYLKMRARARL